MPSKQAVSSSSASSSEEEAEDLEQEEENTPLKTSSSKKFNLNSNPNPNSVTKPDRGSEEEDDDESSGEYESDSDVPTTQNQTSVPLDVKPISSKPMAETLKSKKSSVEGSSGSPVVALASVKRKPDNDEKDGRKDQKKKKVSDLVEDEEKKSGDEKKLFQRFWTDEDEIVILKGMVNFKKKGIDPATQVNSFFDTIKGSLHTDVSKTQVQSKIRTIKRKYQNALKKVKPGADPENLKPHEEKVYHLCKKVWPEGFGKDDDGEGKSVETNVGGVDSKKAQSKKVSDGGSAAAAAASPNLKVTALPSKLPAAPAVVAKDENHQIRSSPEYAYLSGSTIVSNMASTLIPPPGLGEIVSKKGWDVIGSSKAKEFDDKWKSLIIAETKIYLQRIDLVREQTQAMLDVLESSN